MQGWRDENENDVTAGSNNLGVVTVNLPRIALEAAGNKEKFWEIFNERIEIAYDALFFRVERAKEAQPKNAPILFMIGLFVTPVFVGAVDDLYNTELQTCSLGYIVPYVEASTFSFPICVNTF